MSIAVAPLSARYALRRDRGSAMKMQESHAPAAAPRRASSLRAWIMASRPHTLTISVVPVLVGCALAWTESRRIDFVVMLLSMLGALLLQTGTNLDNDVRRLQARDRSRRPSRAAAGDRARVGCAPRRCATRRARASSSLPRSDSSSRGAAAGRSSPPASRQRSQRWRIPAARGRFRTPLATSSSGCSSAWSR